MKQSLLYISVLLLVLIVIGIYTYSGYKKADEEATRFTLESIAAISDEWNPKEFEHRADPGLIKAMGGRHDVARLFRIYGTLGALKKVPDCELMNTAPLVLGSHRYSAATYHCNAEYEAAEAKILITVRKETTKDAWEIYYIKIESGGFVSE